MADLSKVPNVFRIVLGFTELVQNYDSVSDGLEDIDRYMRLVRVYPHHTARDVQDALSAAEGWNTVEECVMKIDNEDELLGNDNIFAEFDTAESHGDSLCLRTWFNLDPSHPLVLN